MIILYRVDDRLIHGQVVEAWIPSLGIEQAIVISDEIAKDELRQRLLHFAMPSELKLIISNVKDAPDELRRLEKEEKNTMAIMPSLREAISISKAGISIGRLNIGGTIYTACRNLFDNTAVFLNDEEKNDLVSLSEQGVKLDCRAVPTDDPLDLLALASKK